jgi:Stress up-regulated Nod 19
MDSRRRSLRAALAALALSLPLAAGVLPACAFARAGAGAGSPLPGGVYAGRTDDGMRVTVRVASRTRRGDIGGTVTLSCAPGDAAFSTGDGSFVARRTRVFKVTGHFAVDRVRGSVGKVAGRPDCGRGRYAASLASPSGVRSKVVRYGPFSVGGMRMGTGTATASAMAGRMRTFTRRNVRKPCSNCSIVGMVPELVYPGGRTANFDTGAMLHHVVLFNTSARDASCPRGAQRFFASGNERTPFVLPAGYGYRVRPNDRWRVLTDLMNMSAKRQKVQVQITFYYVPASAKTAPVRPLWLDVDNCRDSEYAIPAGRSNTAWKFRVPAKMAGRVVAMGGHLHNDGVYIRATNRTTGRRLCLSRAGFGDNRSYMGNIDAMSGCVGEPLGRINGGDTLALNSVYDSPDAQDGVMGIMLAYVASG